MEFYSLEHHSYIYRASFIIKWIRRRLLNILDTQSLSSEELSTPLVTLNTKE